MAAEHDVNLLVQSVCSFIVICEHAALWGTCLYVSNEIDIFPILNNRRGDISDKNNCIIATVTALFLFELYIMNLIESHLASIE